MFAKTKNDIQRKIQFCFEIATCDSSICLMDCPKLNVSNRKVNSSVHKGFNRSQNSKT